MLTLGHILIEILAGRTLEGALLSITPDVIRALGIPRSATHFTGSVELGYSWIKFPEKISMLKKLTSIEQVEFKSVIQTPKMLDELSSVDKYLEFVMANPIEPRLMMSILYHLREDDIFDHWNRRFIGEVPRTDGKEYYVMGEKLSSSVARQRIFQIEQRSIYMLAAQLYLRRGIVFNKKYVDSEIKPVLFELYSENLANTAFNYMTIDAKYDNAITNKDWNVSDSETDKFYEELRELHHILLDKMSYNEAYL